MRDFDLESRDITERGYTCRVCDCVLREPVQLACGHRFCQSCVNNQNGPLVKCTLCYEETLITDSFLDRGMKNDMQSVVVKCSLCSWVDSLNNYQEHFNNCHSNSFPVQNGETTSESSRIVRSASSTSVLPYNPPIPRQSAQVIISETASHETRTPTDENTQEMIHNIVSQEGLAFWIIKNIKNLLNSSESCLTSTPFEQSPAGYKLCAQLSLPSDGTAQSPYLSMSLVLMRGRYDAILGWPFSFQVIFCLYDSSPQRNHIFKAVQTNIRSATCQRPQTDMNIVAHIPEFFPLSIIQHDHIDYLKDDTMYIKILIRKNPIPPSILLDAMRIDPALPVHIQNERIEEAIQKRQV